VFESGKISNHYLISEFVVLVLIKNGILNSDSKCYYIYPLPIGISI